MHIGVSCYRICEEPGTEVDAKFKEANSQKRTQNIATKGRCGTRGG